MPRRKAPPRLYLDRTRGAWVIRDGQKFIRTGCDRDHLADAEGQLAEYIGEKYTPPKTNEPLVLEVLAAYASEIVPHRASRRNIAYNIGSLLKWWGDKKATEVNSRTCRAYADTKTPSAAGADLKVLRAALRHWRREHGPLEFVVWTPTASAPRDLWLTRSDIARLLRAARQTQHIKRLILLGIYTGSRPGVILRLRWDQIDLFAGVLARNRPGEPTHAKKRAPPVRLGRRILSHLRRWRRLDAGTVSFLCHFEGRQVREPHTSWRRIVAKSGLSGRITPHTLRHTRATWLMQAGVSPWEAAGHLGMTVKTLEAIYGHHHPAYQERAAEV
jgi:integrase